jgi:hypothetical protein
VRHLFPAFQAVMLESVSHTALEIPGGALARWSSGGPAEDSPQMRVYKQLDRSTNQFESD